MKLLYNQTYVKIPTHYIFNATKAHYMFYNIYVSKNVFTISSMYVSVSYVAGSTTGQSMYNLSKELPTAKPRAAPPTNMALNIPEK